MHHHRMGSYFELATPSLTSSGGGAVLGGGTTPKKGILSSGGSNGINHPHCPPTPPPTSSIPQKKPPPPILHKKPSGIPPKIIAPTLKRPLATMGLGARPAEFQPIQPELAGATAAAPPPPIISRAERPLPSRPDRFRQRIQFEQNDMNQIHALNKRLASLTIADMSPKLALQRVLLLFDKGEYREAAAFVRRISQATYKQIVGDMPMDLFVDSMPQSMPILEAIYAKLYLYNGGTLPNSTKYKDKFSPESVVWQIVRFFACLDENNGSIGGIGGRRMELCGPWVSTCKRLLSVLISAEPRIKRVVFERKKALTRAIEGLGQHGLVGTSDESLLNLHDALKLQFEKVQKSYTDALSKLDALSLTPKASGSGKEKKPPVAQSHQRQLSLRVDEIQERLIKNKTLLNVVEPTLENPSLEVLLGILQRRIELDKEVLFQFTQMKKDKKLLLGAGSSRNPSVAPVLMKFQKGCQQVRIKCRC